MVTPRRPKGTGEREPERPLMALLSELLRFPHYDCSSGSTVEKPFLTDLAKSLGVAVNPTMGKDQLLSASYEAATGLPATAAILAKGTTVKNDTLRDIANGVIDRGLVRVDMTTGAAAARIAVAIREDADEEGLDVEDPFDPLNLDDERKSSLRRVVDRRGQGKFRRDVLAAYHNRCAISGYREPSALEAAHITPYKGAKSNSISNGLCLRADLHRLWDTGLLAVHEESFEVLISPTLRDTHYGELLGGGVSTPLAPSKQPSPAALKAQREWCGL